MPATCQSAPTIYFTLVDVRIVALSISPEHHGAHCRPCHRAALYLCNRGIGTAIMTSLMKEAAGAGLPVR
jgi:hypothetical protein